MAVNAGMVDASRALRNAVIIFFKIAQVLVGKFLEPHVFAALFPDKT